MATARDFGNSAPYGSHPTGSGDCIGCSLFQLYPVSFTNAHSGSPCANPDARSSFAQTDPGSSLAYSYPCQPKYFFFQ
jgi:hypothetical protein